MSYGASEHSQTGGNKHGFWEEVGTGTVTDGDNPIQIAGGYEGPLYATSPWNTVKFDGGNLQLPGLCTVRAKGERAVDAKKHSGKSGETLTGHGYKNAEVEITVKVWTPAQLARLDECTKSLYLRTAQLEARQIYHPALDRLAIKSVAVLSVSALEPAGEHGAWSLAIKCREYYPVQRKTATKKIEPAQIVKSHQAPAEASNGKSAAATPSNAKQAKPSTSSTVKGP